MEDANITYEENDDWTKVMEPYLHADWEVYLIYTFVPIVVLIGIIGNMFTIIVLTTNKRMRNSLNVYLVNLAISDCLFLMIAPIFMWGTVAESPLHLYYDNRWFPIEYCKFNMFTVDTTYQLSGTLTMAISTERFLAITKPLKYRAYVSTNRTLKICCALWVLTLLWQTRTLVTTSKISLEFPWPDMTNGVPNATTVCVTCAGFEPEVCDVMSYITLFDVILSLLYLALMIPMYGKVFWSVREPFTNKETSTASNRVNYEMKALRTVVITVSVYVLLTAPINVLFVFHYFGYVAQDIAIWIFNIFRFLAFVNSAINPIIYNASNKGYRKAFLELFGASSTKKQNKNGQSMQSFSVSSTVQTST